LEMNYSHHCLVIGRPTQTAHMLGSELLDSSLNINRKTSMVNFQDFQGRLYALLFICVVCFFITT